MVPEYFFVARMCTDSLNSLVEALSITRKMYIEMEMLSAIIYKKKRRKKEKEKLTPNVDKGLSKTMQKMHTPIPTPTHTESHTHRHTHTHTHIYTHLLLFPSWSISLAEEIIKCKETGPLSYSYLRDLELMA